MKSLSSNKQRMTVPVGNIAALSWLSDSRSSAAAGTPSSAPEHTSTQFSIANHVFSLHHSPITNRIEVFYIVLPCKISWSLCTWNSNMDFPLLDSSMKRNAPIPVLGLSASSRFPCKPQQPVSVNALHWAKTTTASQTQNVWIERTHEKILRIWKLLWVTHIEGCQGLADTFLNEVVCDAAGWVFIENRVHQSNLSSAASCLSLSGTELSNSERRTSSSGRIQSEIHTVKAARVYMEQR